MDRMPGSGSPAWQPSTRLAAAVVLILAAALLGYALRSALVVLMAAVVLAYVLHPLVSRLQVHLRFPRWLASSVVYLAILALIGGLAAALGLALSQQLLGLVEDLQTLPDRIPQLVDQAEGLIVNLGPFGFILSRETLESFINPLTSTLQPILSQTGQALGASIAAAASAIGNVFIVFVLGFYLLLDYGMVDRMLIGLMPVPFRPDAERLTRETELIWRAFLRGQLGLALFVGFFVAVVLSFLGVRFSLGLGVIAGILEFVPVFGPAISAALAVIVAFFQGGSWLGLAPLPFALLVLGVMVVIQLVENNVLVPRFIGVSLRLHPILVLVAVIAGASVAGIVGVLVAAPALATLRLWGGYVYYKTVGIDSWPGSPVEPKVRPKRLLARLRRRVRRAKEGQAG
ncbi:MAG: AI-2E family transporter [Anaerolineales bacterium]|nr:AI-2E family transporter [Anaerolineales bacterium]